MDDRVQFLDAPEWGAPDMTVLRTRRAPPALPLDVFGPTWRRWIENAAEAASCPVDYVAGTLLASASALIGNARWPQCPPGWAEPPHLWIGIVGDSGGGKSPGTDAMMRHVLPEIERRMLGDFPERHREWKAANATYGAEVERWNAAVREAGKKHMPPPPPPDGEAPAEPQAPRLRVNDLTIEKLANVLALAAPKGLLILRDELAGWFKGMTAYNEAGRAFWIEAYGGRPYRVERVKHPQPIDVPRLAVSVLGGTQPDKLVEMMDEADDGLLARMCWFWPDPVAFHLASVAPATEWAIAALDRLRLLDLATESADDTPAPLLVPLSADARADMETFGQDMQARQQEAAGLMRSACGKARGTVLRLSLVMEYLWWCASEGMQAPPKQITGNGFAAAAALVSDYLMPMSERVYGDAATSAPDRNAATLARWIVKQRPAEVNVRKLQREVRLPGLSDAASIHEAAGALVEAGWLAERLKGNGNGRPKASYAANPHLWTVAP